MQASHKAGPMLALLALAVTAVGPAQAALIHDYELNDSYADSLGGPSLTPNGGSLSIAGYTFGANQGPLLTNPGVSDTYSIDMTFDVDNIQAADGHNGYVKLLDFKNLANDNGLYVLNGLLDYYNGGQVANSSTALFTPGTSADLLFSRDGATNQLTASVNGVVQFSVADGSGASIFDTSGNVINFLHDDIATSGRESSGGVVTRIKIYDTATISPAPEPSQIAIITLLSLGLGGLLLRARRRKTPSSVP